MRKRFTLEECNEKYWDAKPEFKNEIKVIEKKYEFSKSGKSLKIFVKLLEVKTQKESEFIQWSNVLSSNRIGVPDTFSIHPMSVENMTCKFWETKPIFKNKVSIIDKKCKVNKSGKSRQIFVKLFEESSKKESDFMRWDFVLNLNTIGIPQNFDCYPLELNRPCNDKLCIVYFCKTKTYGEHYKKHKNGPYLTIGITVRESAKERYQGNGHIKTFHEFETYNCNIHEKSLLEQITALLGKPEAGNEAWQWSQNREDIIKKLFLDHFLKDYIETLDIKHTIMP